jgi:ascorbate-specific PTS system EIIC-type component UlaA
MRFDGLEAEALQTAGAFMLIEVQIVNAFIDGAAGGNPAGVVVDANALTAAQKLTVAQRVGLSETAFVSASNSATIKLDFFTPTRQIAHCGHATIATFSLLRHLGLISDGRLPKKRLMATGTFSWTAAWRSWSNVPQRTHQSFPRLNLGGTLWPLST